MRTAINGLFMEDRRVLLLRKKDTWILPGGKPENGETDEVCLRREIREELSSTEISNLNFYGNFQGQTPHKGDILEARIYLVSPIGKISVISAEIKEKRFVSYQEATSLNLSDITRKIVNKVYSDKLLK